MNIRSVASKTFGILAMAAVLLPAGAVFAQDNGSAIMLSPGNTIKTSIQAMAKVHMQEFGGTVTSTNGTSINFSSKGTSYTVDTVGVKLLRRFGAPMLVTDFQNNDQIMVRGTLNGTAITATQIRDTSLQAHNGSFSGTVASVSTTSFTLNSKNRGPQTVNFDSTTAFKKNGTKDTSADLTTGATVTVNGVWDRTNDNITAKTVNIIVKMARISISGTLSALNGTTLTVAGTDGVTYSVDAAHARFVRLHYSRSNITELNVNDKLSIMGTRVVGATSVTASSVRDLSITSKTVSASTSTSVMTH